MSEVTAKPAVGNPNLRVIIIDDESQRIPDVLGIIPEREKEIDEILSIAFKESDTLTDVLVYASKYCKHANELAYAVFHIGAFMGTQKLAEKIKSENSSSDED